MWPGAVAGPDQSGRFRWAAIGQRHQKGPPHSLGA